MMEQTIGSASGLILALAMYPDKQRKAQAELDGVVGPGRLPDFDDFAQLPYLRALIKEVIRFWPVAPLGESVFDRRHGIPADERRCPSCNKRRRCL